MRLPFLRTPPNAPRARLVPAVCAVIALATLGTTRPAAAQSSPSTASSSIPTSGMLGYEVVRLPQGERMGLVGGSLLFDIGNDWALGPAVYGAATGHRGGFFAGGVEVQRRWGIVPGLALATGLYAGGGGGAAAPVGNGLMLRPALTLLKDLGPSLQAGVSLSAVRFPSGQISSRQLGLTLAWRNEFDYLTGASGSPTPVPIRSTGLGFDRMAATVSAYRLTDGTGRRVDLVGAQAERRSSFDGFTWGMEAAAAAKGGAAGYMEFLGTAQFSVAPLETVVPSWRAGARLGV
ncbi:MAG: hypothetical protein M3O01_10430, partial [Pseudomonadota bacterium]|nr:hypothetical protein [Pseudomonadota bacterium]